MNQYPSIDGARANNSRKHLGEPCIAFYKYDGSNLRVEYQRKRGWFKWGTRRRLFDHTDAEFAPAIEIFNTLYAEKLERAIIDNKEYRGCENAIAFLEYFGPHSFAGQHDPTWLKVENNDPKQLVLFDINIHRKGIIGPRDFIKNFGQVEIPQVIYDGPLTEEFIQDVRDGKYPVVEGVVCKGGSGHKLWMAKVKTTAYLEKLKKVFGNDYEKYWE